MRRTSVCLLALLLVGCAGYMPENPVSPGNGNDGNPSVRVKAFFHVNWPNLDDPEWHDSDLVVVTPGVSIEEIRARGKPDATLLAYVNLQTVPFYGETAPFFQRYREAMDDDDWYFLEENGDRVAGSRWRVWQQRPHLEGARAKAEFFAVEVLEVGWDGLYVDMSTAGYSIQILQEDIRVVPEEEWPELQRQYAAHRRYFLAELRELLPDALIVANTWGPKTRKYALRSGVDWRLTDEEYGVLNGVTIEDPEIVDLPFFLEVARLSRGPILSVSWNRDLFIPGVVMPGEVID